MLEICRPVPEYSAEEFSSLELLLPAQLRDEIWDDDDAHTLQRHKEATEPFYMFAERKSSSEASAQCEASSSLSK